MSGRALRDGALAGLVGGAVSAAYGLAMSPILGTDPLGEARLAAVPLLGEAAAEEQAALALVVGGAAHFAVSAAWGIVFTLACGGLLPRARLAAGVAFGVLVWAAMFHAVLPALGAAWIAAGLSTARALVEHAVYGAGVALGLLLVRPRGG